MSRPAGPLALIGALVLASYTALAWAVGSFYPFSVYPMYAQAPAHRRAARLGARTASGELVELTRFEAFECDRRIDPASFPALCGHAYAPEYLDHELSQHVDAHAARVPDGEPIEVVRRIWSFDEDGAIEATECVLARCTASR